MNQIDEPSNLEIACGVIALAFMFAVLWTFAAIL